MSAMEHNHEFIFQEMRKTVSEEEKAQNTFDPDDEANMYLQTMAESHGFEGKVSINKKLTGKESIKDILEIALEAEKESVVFYFGIKSFVPDNAGKDKVEAVIKEELGHIATLNKYYNKLVTA
jgi:rubrerythrin